MKLKSTHIAIVVLIILHAVGLFGTAYYNENLIKLTPINLLISIALVLWFHVNPNKQFIAYLLIVFLCGYLIELVGIRTGKIFGQYFYGFNLGYKLADVPVVIGINWIMLSYGSMNIVGLLSEKIKLFKNQFMAPLIGATLMVFADYWIELMCNRLDFWYWKGSVIPLQNFTAWFLFSFAFNFLFVRLQLPNKNIVAASLYIIQVLFFIGLNYFMI